MATQAGSLPSVAGNLLQNRFISGFMKSRWFPGILQWPTAIVFSVIIWELLFGPPSAHDNFGTAMTWVLWWPMIPIVFVFMGRFWCAICPFGTLSDVVQKFVGHNRPVPSFLKNYGIWIIDATFIFITWSDHVFGIVESPWGSAVLLMMLIAAVVVTAAIWARRTWCRHLCFLGGLSSNYSQTGMLALRGTPEKCSKCTVAACYKGTESVAGCPMFEFPKTMDTNSQCNLCGNCVKSCPNGSPSLTSRLPTEELWSISKPKLAAAFLAVVIMGIVFVQNITMLDVWGSVLGGLESVLGTDSLFATFTVAFTLAMAIPVGLLALASGVAKRFNGESVAKNFATFGYAIIPLDVAAHIAHNLFHLLAEGKSVAFTGLALFGLETHDASPALLDTATINILQYLLIALGVAGSLYTAYRLGKRGGKTSKNRKAVLPYAVLIVLFGAVNIVLFSIPMAMRM